MIEPLLRCFELGPASWETFEVVDVGMGNGDLVRRLAAHVAAARQRLGMPPPSIRVWGVDLDPGVLGSSSRVGFDVVEQADYREWLDVFGRYLYEARPRTLRIALFSKVLDVFTSVSLQPDALDSSRTHDLLSRGAEDRVGRYACAAAIAAGTHIAHPSAATCSAHRTFEPSAADTASGASALEALARQTDAVVIEDPDFGPEQLRAHCQRHALNSIVAFDLSDRLRLTSHCLVIARADRLRSNPGGVRIW